VGTTKRERQKQGRQARIAQAQAAAAKRKRTRGAVLLGGLVVLLVAATLVLGGLSGDDDEDVTAGSTSSTLAGSSTSAGETPPTIAVTIPPAGASIEGETPCPEADGSSERTTTFAQAPPTCIDPARTYTATVTTTHGEFTLELDDEAAPIAVNNFVALARYHYYDGVAFHRIIPQFMIQSGDAIGPSPGQGGPGYAIDDELPTGEDAYPSGTLAMANSGPNTSGSQFFVMATGSSGLSNDYTVFGRVIAGQEVVDAINQLGDAATNGTPTAEVNIQTITITEG
jgi:cyclophilin family peptidyl-prolyl cis-trans isomerase